MHLILHLIRTVLLYSLFLKFVFINKKEITYENTTKILIPGVLSGFNATIFAYGGTGAGKTFT